MRMDPQGSELLRDIVKLLKPESLQKAGYAFQLFVENNDLLLAGWEAAVHPTEAEQLDSRQYLTRLTKHTCETMLRDWGTLVLTELNSQLDGETELRGVMFEIKFDDESSMDRELGNGIVSRIVKNNVEMIATIGGKLRQADAPVAMLALMLQGIAQREFTETGRMLRGQLEIIRQAAAERGVELTPLAPLASWQPPTGAQGH